MEQKINRPRREWLLRLAGAGALVGFRGEVLHALDAVAALGRGPSAENLPPGLYEPSSDHLSHALTGDELFHPIPEDSPTDYRRPREGPYTPQFFSAEEFRIAGRLAEIILGEPKGSAASGGGAASIAGDAAEWLDSVAFHSAYVRAAASKLALEHRALAVRYYGAGAVERLEKFDPQEICRRGLDWLARESSGKFAKPFLELDDAQQTALLTSMTEAAEAGKAPDVAREFISLMKHECARAFYTSPAGLKELDYKGNSFYAESPGCTGHDHSNHKERNP